MARLLLIDDDPSLRDALSLALEDAGYQVDDQPDGLAGLDALRRGPYDLVISDINMPGLDGFSLCRRVREGGSGIPIILLTARDGEIDEALGLELGADDYVSKPFSTRILLARVSALLRREQQRRAGTTEVSTTGELALDAARLEARYSGTLFETTVTEFRLLQALTRRPGVVFSRGQLLERIREDDSVVAERLIDTYVRRLRRKIEAIDPGFSEIETVIGAGYRWRG